MVQRSVKPTGNTPSPRGGAYGVSRSILVVTPVALDPPTAGNRARIMRFVERCMAAGAHVAVAHIDIIPSDPTEDNQGPADDFVRLAFRSHDRLFRWTRRFRTWVKRHLSGFPRLLRLVRVVSTSPRSDPLEFYFDPHVAKRLDEEVERRQPDTILFLYVILAPYASHLAGKARLIVDTQDRLADRLQRVPGSVGAFSLSADDERRALQAFDVIIAIQDQEAQYFSLNSGANVVTIGHQVILNPIDLEQITASQAVLFLGSHNAVNVVALRRIQRDLWPEILRKNPDATLLVGGQISSEAERQAGVIALGPVNDLREFYGRGRLVLNPPPFGTGLKIKNIEALGFGLPVVTSPTGAEGLQPVGAGMLVGDTDAALVNHVCTILRDTPTLHRLRSEAIHFVTEWNASQDQRIADVFSL